MNGKKRLALIPARGGSKRVPGKNIRDFHGKPMIAHPIRAALDSGIFDVVNVSTDSEDIAAVAETYGANVDFRRPPELADDMTPLLPVAKYVAQQFAERGDVFDTVALLYATSPMLFSQDLKEAVEAFESGDALKPLLAVAPFPCPVEWAFRLEGGMLAPVAPGGFAIRSQDLKPAYFDAAMFCFYSREFLNRSAGAGSDLVFRGFPVDARRVTDIDTPDQWAMAEAMYRALHDRP